MPLSWWIRRLLWLRWESMVSERVISAVSVSFVVVRRVMRVLMVGDIAWVLV